MHNLYYAGSCRLFTSQQGPHGHGHRERHLSFQFMFSPTHFKPSTELKLEIPFAYRHTVHMGATSTMHFIISLLGSDPKRGGCPLGHMGNFRSSAHPFIRLSILPCLEALERDRRASISPEEPQRAFRGPQKTSMSLKGPLSVFRGPHRDS